MWVLLSRVGLDGALLDKTLDLTILWLESEVIGKTFPVPETSPNDEFWDEIDIESVNSALKAYATLILTYTQNLLLYAHDDTL